MLPRLIWAWIPPAALAVASPATIGEEAAAAVAEEAPAHGATTAVTVAETETLGETTHPSSGTTAVGSVIWAGETVTETVSVVAEHRQGPEDRRLAEISENANFR